MLTNKLRLRTSFAAHLVVAFWTAVCGAQPASDDADVEVTAEPPRGSPAAPAAAPAPSPAPTTVPAAPAAAPPPPAAPSAPPPAPQAPAPGAPAARQQPATPARRALVVVAPSLPPPPAVVATKAKEQPLVEVRGYAQMEYQHHADSEDQLLQGTNTPLNQDRFLVRRARLIVARAWQYTALDFEFDGNTTNGPSFGLYRGEASVFYRPSDDKAPLAQLTLGQFRTPFGFELLESPSTRWFMERSQLSRALYPTEIDVGGRVSGEAGPFRYVAALTNGEPLTEKSGFQLQDPNKTKDFTISLGAKGDLLEWLHLDGGVSAVKGRGFHPGTPASKATASWVDQNENGVVDNGEIRGTGAQAAVSSESFQRWAVGADLRIEATSPLGTTAVYGEIVAAKNMDRGFFPADPVISGQDAREFGYYVGVLQEITPYAVVGFRADFYDPNADATNRQASKTLPVKNTVRTYSPLIGVTLPNRARLVFQYDVIKDYLARNGEGVPANLDNDEWTLRLQVNL